VADTDTITSVSVATIRSPLPIPVNFGPWRMEHREFALCRIDTESGLSGLAFCYTRDGPIAELVQSDESLPAGGACPNEEGQSGGGPGDDSSSAPAADV